MLSQIVLDIDGPLAFDNWRLRGYFNYMQGMGVDCSYMKYLTTGEWFEAIPGKSRLEITKLWCSYLASQNITDEPTPGAANALRSLSHYERVIATARSQSESAHTRTFLEQHFGAFSTYHFALDCKRAAVMTAAYFIDDNYGVARKVAGQASNGLRVILFPTPTWPRQGTHPRVILLEAEALVTPDMTESQWRAICQVAWEEIISIVCPQL